MVMLNKKIRNKNGTFSIEYAFCILVVIAALVGISIYFTRAICGKFRASADVFGYGRQYSPP